MFDDLFGEGVPKDGFIIKAHLRVPVRPHPVAIVQECVDALTQAHEACSASVRAAATSTLSRVPTPEIGNLFALPGIAKAAAVAPAELPGAQQYRIKHPGLRGGKWWRDKQGIVRYGDQPGPEKTTGKAPEEKSSSKPNQHFKMTSVGHDPAFHGDITQHLSRNDRHQFSAGDLKFLDWWHKQGIRQLVEQYGGMSTDDLNHGTDGMRFQSEEGGGDMAFEDAVNDFFASQDWGGADYESQVAPLLQDLFERYHDATQDPKVVGSVDKKENQRLMRWFAKAQKTKHTLRKMGNIMSASYDARVTALSVISALTLMDLINQLTVEGIATAAPNEKLLGEGMRRLGSVLHQRFGKSFSSLSSVQLMLAFVGASLNAVWDPKNRNYYTGGGVPDTALGGQALETLATKSGLGTHIDVLKAHLKEVSSLVASHMNGAK